MLRSQIPSYFKQRRDRLMKAHAGATFIFPATSDFLRNGDVHYPFRQESNFYYLTGFEEPQSLLVLAPGGSQGKSYRTILFVAPRDPEKEMWEGERYGVEGAVQVFGADEAYPFQEFDKKILEIIHTSDRLFYRLGVQPELDRRMVGILESNRRSHGRSGRGLLPLEDPTTPLGELRLFKSSEEVELMRKGCEITALAHKTAMKEVRPGMNEAEVEALVDFVFRKHGCARVGYGSIVAGGKNATCLHYRSNNERLNDGELLLIDAGGEYEYYSADITRTFPIGRKFSSTQAKVYDLVLQAQKAGIEMTRPGVRLPEIHKQICEIMIEGMLSFKLLNGTMEEILKTGGFKRFYPHNTSHWLGMDVHDAGLYLVDGSPRVLEPGMVFTIEPGFYVQPSDRQAPTDYKNIGIRIEDDVLVTPKGSDVLTRGVPKEIAEIEALRG